MATPGNSTRGQRAALFALFAAFYAGAWFSAMAIYAKITFSPNGGYLNSFLILALSLLPPLVLGRVNTALMRRAGAPIACAGALAVSAAVCGMMISTDNVIWLLVGVTIQAAAHSLVYPLRHIARRAFYTHDELPLANARIARLQVLCTVLAPLAAGALAGLSSAQVPLAIDMLLCGVGALVAWKLSARIPRESDSSTRAAVAEERTPGKSAYAELARLAPLFSRVAGAMFVVIGFDLAYPVFIRDTGLGGINGFSMVLAAFSAGSFLATWAGRFIAGWRAPIMAMGAVAIPLLVSGSVARTFVFPIMLACGLLVGIAHVVVIVSASTSIQTDPEFGAATAVASGIATSGGQMVAVVVAAALFQFPDPYTRFAWVALVVVAGLVVAGGRARPAAVPSDAAAREAR